jgi:hypothetical protein
VGAGESARRQAERYQRLADQWSKGAQGEERTADVLGRLSVAGYFVLHDLRVPGSRANVDHVVIGRTGVFAIDSKQYSGRVSVNKGTMWLGRYPQTKKLATTRWEADQVSAALGGVPVVAVQCIHGSPVPAVDRPVQGVEVCDGEGLVDVITGRAGTLTLDECSRLVIQATAAMGAGSRPVPVRLPAPSRLKPSPSRPIRRSTPVARVPARRAGRRSAPRRGSAVVGIVGSAAALLAGWVILPGLVRSAVKGITDVASRPSVSGFVACPAPGRGLVLALSWPGDRPDTTGYQVRWQTGGASSSDMWPSSATHWTHPVAPGASITVAVSAMSASRHTGATSRTFTAPATPC